ncbi:thioredoxin [Anaerostipes sp.]|uniref:thioredoxin n=1 Tax=Anaerostipes sp. TaxID=1872530 RepID=UPI0025C34FDB|nr:thioredoxin [Anaerostipes sp.]MBS7007789.1 thioredoxin [Anaerostipes sp.]
MSIINITNENFQSEVAESKKPVLVDFWAPWCGYCRRISPALDKLGEENEDAVQIGKINIDEQMELAERFQVMTIPTMILFKDGQAGEPLVAAQSKGQIEKWLQDQGMLS